MTPFRDRIANLGPPWFLSGTGQRLMYCPGTGVDIALERLTESTVAHMPTRCNPTSLPVLGADRGPLVQGPGETDDSFRVRLQKAPALWAKWGSPFSILEQLAAYFLPAFPTLYLVTDAGHWYTLVPGANGSSEVTLPPSARPPAIASNWQWDNLTAKRVTDGAVTATLSTLTSASAPFVPGDVGKSVQVVGAGIGGKTLVTTIAGYTSPTSVDLAAPAVTTVTGAFVAIGSWWRFWIIVDASGGLFQQTFWGTPGQKWGQPGLVWGGNFGPNFGGDVRAIIRQWMPEHSFCQNIIVDFTGHFVPTGSGPGYPNGTWQFWVNRFQPAAYLDGVSPDA